MMVTRKRLSLGGLFIGLAAVSYWTTASVSTPRSEEPLLQVDAPQLNFGEVWASSAFQWKVHVRNVGSEDVEISNLAAACNCMSIEPAKLSIAPGETEDIRLVLDLWTESGKAPVLPARDYSTYIGGSWVSASRTGRFGWSIRGRVKNAFALSQRQMDLGEQPVEKPFEEESVVVSPLVPLSLLEANCSDSDALAEVDRHIHGTDDFEIRVSPRKPSELGPFEFSIEITATTERGGKLPAVSLTVLGVAVGDVQVTPGRVMLLPATIDQSREATITLKSRSNRKFQVDRVVSDSEDTLVERVTEDSGTEQIYRLRQTISGLGNQESRVTFVCRTGDDGQPREYVVPIYWHGLAKNPPKQQLAGE